MILKRIYRPMPIRHHAFGGTARAVGFNGEGIVNGKPAAECKIQGHTVHRYAGGCGIQGERAVGDAV